MKNEISDCLSKLEVREGKSYGNTQNDAVERFVVMRLCDRQLGRRMIITIILITIIILDFMLIAGPVGNRKCQFMIPSLPP